MADTASTRNSGAVTVFVDDAVRGDFPPICARSGRYTEEIVRYQRRTSTWSAWTVLLLFLGPPGWIVALVLLLMSSGGETLTVRLPYHPDEFARDRRLRNLKWTAVTVAAVSVVGAFALVGTGPGGVWVAIGLAALGVLLVLMAWQRFDDIGFELDASRRWVTFRRVHPAFIDAVQANAQPVQRSANRFLRNSRSASLEAVSRARR